MVNRSSFNMVDQVVLLTTTVREKLEFGDEYFKVDCGNDSKNFKSLDGEIS